MKLLSPKSKLKLTSMGNTLQVHVSFLCSFLHSVQFVREIALNYHLREHIGNLDRLNFTG